MTATNATNRKCFCGNDVAEGFNLACSNTCHNRWMLGHEEIAGRPVGKGWHSIIDQLHEDILKLDPNYVIQQIKEKFGTLRYYCNYKEPEYPLNIQEEQIWALQSVISDFSWTIDKHDREDLRDEHFVEWPAWKLEKARKYRELLIDMNNKLNPIAHLICKAENLSAITCESCGQPGTQRSGGWIKTLCDSCATERNR